MFAVICDKCNKTIAPVYLAAKVNIQKDNPIPYPDDDYTIHLCDDCLKEVFNFYNFKKGPEVKQNVEQILF